MGVFICWSGENTLSQVLAKILRDRIPEILQTADPLISGVDIGAGQVWMSELTKALRENHFGILCITPENKDSPWIHFEAGALWKADEGRRVCPLLYDIRPSGLTGPLSQLQSKQLDRDGFLDLMKEVNKLGCSVQIEEGLLERIFNKVWPEIWDAVSNIEVPATAPKKPRRPEDMIEEILEIVRSLQRTHQEEMPKLDPRAIADAIDSLRHTAFPMSAPVAWSTKGLWETLAADQREHEFKVRLLSVAQNLDPELSETLQNGSVRFFNEKLVIYDFPAAHRASFEALQNSQYREDLSRSVLPLRVQVKCEDSVFKL